MVAGRRIDRRTTRRRRALVSTGGPLLEPRRGRGRLPVPLRAPMLLTTR
jgi:hypothetical protein